MLCRRAAAREQGIQPGPTTPASRPCAGSDRVRIKTSGGLYLARHEKRLEFLRNVRGPVRDVKVADHEDEHLNERKKADGVDLVRAACVGGRGAVYIDGASSFRALEEKETESLCVRGK